MKIVLQNNRHYLLNDLFILKIKFNIKFENFNHLGEDLGGKDACYGDAGSSYYIKEL